MNHLSIKVRNRDLIAGDAIFDRACVHMVIRIEHTSVDRIAITWLTAEKSTCRLQECQGHPDATIRIVRFS